MSSKCHFLVSNHIKIGMWHFRCIPTYIQAYKNVINGIKVETREQEAGPPTGKPINIKLTSKNKDLLFSEAIRLKKFMDNYPGLVNVEDNLPAPGTTELEQDFYQDNIDLISESIINEFSAFINLNT